MAHVGSPSLIRQLGALFESGSAAGLSDRELLERFTAPGNSAGEAAFAAIVSRHGPMVLGICRRLLGDHHHAEDAFQAVFLVLARRSRSIRDPDLLSTWLYGVALRTARKAKGRLDRRRKREEFHAASSSEASSAIQADQSAIDREQAEALHAEIARLPSSFRLPLILCYFEGLSPAEAARRLRCPAGTVHSRLVRARDKLRRRLTRRGVVLPVAALIASMEPRSAWARVPPQLCDSTARAAIQFAAQRAGAAGGGAISASAAALAQGVMRAMLVHMIKVTVTSLLIMAAVAAAGGWLARSLAMKEDPVKEAAASVVTIAPGHVEQSKSATKPDRAAGSRMTVAGRVLDPDGNPVNGAVVDLVARPRVPWVGASDEVDRHTLLGQGRSDADGRFQLDSPRTGSIRVFEVTAIAAAPGFGLGWAELNPDAERPVAEIRLRPEQLVRVRLVDVTGAPAGRVEVTVLGVEGINDKGNFAKVYVRSPKGIRVWPPPVTTDDQGRIVLPGIGRGSRLSLRVSDLRYARQDLYVDSAKASAAKEITIALEPARIIEGRVLAADTGKPIPNAVVEATTPVHNEHANGIFSAKYRADDQGRFKINPITGESCTLRAFPAGGEPYLIRQDKIQWTKGTVKATHDIKLPRGVLIRGKVTEQETGRPLAASSIQFIPVRGSDKVLSGWQAIVASQDDGLFQITVPAGRGHLLVFGPTGDYVLGEIGSNRIHGDQPGGIRYHAHAIIPYKVKVGDPPHEVAAALRPGVTIKGRVDGPGGQTITDGFVLTTLRIEAFNPMWRGDYQVAVRDGRFELHGVAPDASTRIHILDPEHEWGATVEVSGRQAGEDLILRLQPCGRARARFVGPDGEPVAKHRPHFEFVATPGPSRYSRSKQDQAKLAADAAFVANVDRKHYWSGPLTDAEGRITLPALIPGALYRITDFSTVNDQDKGIQVRRDFTVKPGETLDLGDILIEKPGS